MGNNIISTVSLVKCQTYENSNVEAALEKALELIGDIGNYVRSGEKILLKIKSPDRNGCSEKQFFLLMSISTNCD